MCKRWLVFGVLTVLAAAVWSMWQLRYDGADPRAIFWPAQPPPRAPAALEEIVSLHVDRCTLQEVLTSLERRYSVTIEIDDAALRDIGASSGAQVTLHAEGLTLRSVLELLVRQAGPHLVAVERGGGFLATSEDHWKSTLGNYSTRTYRLDGLVAHSADRVDEAAVAKIVHDVVPVEDWRFETRTSAVGLGKIDSIVDWMTIDMDEIDFFIDASVSLGSPLYTGRSTALGPGRIDRVPGGLVVQQLPETHRRIEALLAGLARMQVERNRREPLVLGVPDTVLAGRRRVLQVLDDPCSIDIHEIPFDETIAALAGNCGIPIVIDLGALNADNIPIDAQVTHQAHNVSLRSLLNQLLRKQHLTFMVRDAAILVTTYEVAEAEAGVRLYPVADLTGGHFRPDELVEFVTGRVAPDTWSDVGGPESAACFDGVLLVRQTDENHDAVERLLAELRHVLLPSIYPPPADRPVDVAERRIKAALEEPAAFGFHEKPLEQVMEFVARSHGLSVMLDTRALSSVGIDADTPVTFSAQRMPLKPALRLLLRDLDLTYRIRDETLLITTPEEAEANLITRMYKVPPVLQARVGDRWINQVTMCVEPDSWEDVGGPGAISIGIGGKLFYVSQTEGVHERVLAFLAVLDRAIEHCRDETQPVDLLEPPLEFARQARAKLQQRTSVDFHDVELWRVVQQLAERHGVPIVLDRRALDGVGIGANAPVTLTVEDVSLRTALNLIARQLDLVLTVDSGVIQVITQEEAETRLYGRIYPVAGLVDRVPMKSVEALSDVLVEVTNSDNWEDYGGPSSIDALGGVLLIYTTLDVHRQIEPVLAALREPPPLAGDAADGVSFPVGFAPGSVEIQTLNKLAAEADVQIVADSLGEAIGRFGERFDLPAWINPGSVSQVEIDAARRIRFSLHGAPLGIALQLFLDRYDLAYAVCDEMLVIGKAAPPPPRRGLTWSAPAALRQAVCFYPIGDLQQRFVPPGELQPALLPEKRSLPSGWAGCATNCWGGNPPPAAAAQRPPDHGWAKTFAERLEEAIEIFSSGGGEPYSGAAVFGEMLCAAGPPEYHRTIEHLLATLRETAAGGQSGDPSAVNTTAGQDVPRTQVLSRLTRPVSLTCNDVPLEEAVDRLSRAGGLPVCVVERDPGLDDPFAREVDWRPLRTRRVSCSVENVSLREAVAALSPPGAPLAAYEESGVVNVAPLGDAKDESFVQLYDVRPVLRAYPELDVGQLGILMWLGSPGQLDAKIAALPSLLVVYGPPKAHAEVARILAYLPTQARSFPRPADLFLDDNRAAVAALARRLRESDDPDEAAWLAAMAAMIDRPLTNAGAAQLAAALNERMARARTRREANLVGSACHAIAQLGGPAAATVAERLR